ncbi:hypothetical protein Pyn_21304 [Prunus yedoensis var. nudiflora]|uniref:Uncharacterized protein n=1 Tax=Prunus yedoensis var. nudiflora TaxID=2094558 RepID=A0A314Y2U4_PRUYE|nr:hypothetical protein Pyn_21304 [Prunus yedoensis var. nudiflora]
MIGLTKSTSGTAYVQGLDIQTQMDEIYTSMGVCPQHDLLWETLTGREHLLFYGRLKNLKGSALIQAVEESLKSVNLFYGGVADKQAGKYSGEVLCDRLGVFVDGSLQCIGNPKELKARYGGSYVFTMTTSSNHEEEVENLVRRLSPNATRYTIFLGPRSLSCQNRRFTVFAWGLADTTLEDVFIKVALEAQASNILT